MDPGEAKEILGARDLHIVDVYDVDKTGKSARSYGRIYYVNHHLLVFYAFDLAKTEKNHIAAAFQAWGFRQPHSSTAESLGLFYLDNASLNRWTLRVSDPQVLSRIDTLFVTVERPGGSRFPKGRRLANGFSRWAGESPIDSTRFSDARYGFLNLPCCSSRPDRFSATFGRRTNLPIQENSAFSAPG